jgi:hypothetical protein
MATRGTVDQDAARELELYAENEYKLYNQKKSIVSNLIKKHKKGKYDAKLAPKLWGYWVEAAAKLYAKEFSRPAEWNLLFSKATRDWLAKDLEESYRPQIERGEEA